jgi:predicted nuclease of restriction endonuclease-like (RecB) superfamily
MPAGHAGAREFGREFTLVGEEYPVSVSDETYRIDLLLFHRGLRCLVVVELKTGEFKPEHIGKVPVLSGCAG